MQPSGYGYPDPLSATFTALADPTRRAILARLALGEASVTELAKPFAMSQPAISKHLKVLERAGLISSGQDAQRRPRRLEPQPLAEATRAEALSGVTRENRDSLLQTLELMKTNLMAANRAPIPEKEAHYG